MLNCCSNLYHRSYITASVNQDQWTKAILVYRTVWSRKICADLHVSVCLREDNPVYKMISGIFMLICQLIFLRLYIFFLNFPCLLYITKKNNFFFFFGLLIHQKYLVNYFTERVERDLKFGLVIIQCTTVYLYFSVYNS